MKLNTSTLADFIYSYSFLSSPNHEKRKKEIDIYRMNNNVVIDSEYYYKIIPMKDTFWDNFTGDSWEARVRRAFKEAEMKILEYKKEEEFKDYKVNKLKV